MKNPAIIIILLVLISMKSTAYASSDEELEDLASIVMANEFYVTEWDVTIKEKMPIGRALEIVGKLEQDHILTQNKNEKMTKYILQIKNKNKLSETYEIIIPNSSKNLEYAHVSVVIYGSGWDEKIQANYKNKIISLKRHYFTKYARKYVCLYATNDAIIGSVDYIKDLKQQLGLIHTSTQVDTEQQSTYERIIYGYTPLWQQAIQMGNKPMNVQIVVKQTDNNKMNVMIGTPILLNEY